MTISPRRSKGIPDGLIRRTTGWIERNCPWLPASLTAAGLVVGLSSVGGTDVLEQQGYSLLHQLQARFHPIDWDSRIVVVAIDEPSLAEYGRFPWSRDRYAQLLETLWVTQPAVISFDVLMPETTPEDALFAQAIADSGNVVLAVGNDGNGYALEVAATLAEPAASAFITGHVNNWPDTDGVSRQAPLYINQFPSLGVATTAVYLSSLAQTQQAALPVESRQLERLAETRATDPDIPVWLKWPGPVPSDAAPGSSLRVLSFADVAEGRIDLSELQNKIVLVGVTALGIDPIRTPFHLAAPTSGVYLHAAIVDNLLCQRFLTRLPRRDAYLGLIVLSGVAGCLFYGRGAQGQLLGCVGFPIVWLGLVYGAFVMQYWLPLAAPIGTVWLTAAGVQLQIQRDKQQLMNLFAMSVAPETAQIIWQRKQEIFDQGELAAQELTATVLFMDIRGFTGIAEKLSSQALMDWLNEYFEVMTDGIMAHGGVVDKYIGDAIMAVFGAPFPRSQPEQIQADAVAAVRASLQMHQALIALNHRFARRQWPTIAFGIGIHTGPLIAGTVGNRHRMNYSMFGDTVNIAARLEKLTKDLPPTAGYRVLISADTQALIQNDFKTPLVRSAALRGRAKQTEIYTVDRLLGLEA